MKTPVEIAYKKHNQWTDIVITFGGLNKEEAEDMKKKLEAQGAKVELK